MPISYLSTTSCLVRWPHTVSSRNRKPGVVEDRPPQHQEVRAQVQVEHVGPASRTDQLALRLVERHRGVVADVVLVELHRGRLEAPPVAGARVHLGEARRRAGGPGSSCRWRARPRRSSSSRSQPTRSRASSDQEPKSYAACGMLHAPAAMPSSLSSSPGRARRRRGRRRRRGGPARAGSPRRSRRRRRHGRRPRTGRPAAAPVRRSVLGVLTGRRRARDGTRAPARRPRAGSGAAG